MKQIQWFPGHMAKTKAEISADIKMVDIVIELLDARIPISSSNPLIASLIGNKKRLILLNKSDLASKEETDKWIEYFNSEKIPAMAVNSTKNNLYTKQIYKKITDICEDKIARNLRKGIKNTTIRAMVVGIPNVGKSTLINSVSNKAATKTGNKPGVTKSKQWIRLNKNIELLDTPGILWHRFENETVARNLAFIGSIKDDIMDISDLAYHLIVLLQNSYQGSLSARYDVNEEKPALDLLNDIAIKRGCLLKGGLPNVELASKLILDDFRKQKFGNFTLERVNDIDK